MAKLKIANEPYSVFLVTFEKSFSSSNIFGQFISSDDGFHIVDPIHQIAEIRQESMQEVRVVQATFSFLQLSQNI